MSEHERAQLMRPLPFPEDLYWHELDETSYDLELERMNLEYNRQFEAHMGNLNQPYKLTLDEIKDQIEFQEKQIKDAKRLKAPIEIIEAEQEKLDCLVQMWTSKDYIRSDADKNYRKRYEVRRSTFKFDWVPNVPDHVMQGIKERSKASENEQVV